jgi:hypothetical protein
LVFQVESESGASGNITLQNSWEINKQNEIVYTYEKFLRDKKQKVIKAIAIKGHWEISERQKIIYVLNKETGSKLDLKVSAGKSTAKGLEYEIGIGATSRKKVITLFGSWRINPKIGLLFQMPYEEGKLKKVVFGASGRLDKNLNLEMRLESSLGEDLGIDIKLSKSILRGQGEAFIRALRSQKEIFISAGIGLV